MGHDRRVPIPSLVLVVRHATTEWSDAGRHTGRTDVPLTARGEAETEALGPLVESRLGGVTPVVYSSPLQRARRTAALAFGDLHVVVDPRLVEFDYGEYEGLTSAEIQARVPGWELFTHPCPGGETVDQVAARCDSFIAGLPAEGHVVVVTHGHVGRILTARLLGWAPEAALQLYSDTASVGSLVGRRGVLVLDGWNARVSRRA